ncbi:hypothetical protein BX616_002823 [Lobosporangium transversale]|uniref:Glutathione S-transferase n=1 Tax=Lobosporangium transversale TaxID=64571 RepID=A0A1Y2G6X0_9FUNG|nr:glutathione S-transferase [Lobosporangium transversale]KAF9916784.1 hypothetical protein BX616_002823 [Lobosporangium transversale]ORY99575.1 glutathione S-transferase [Lobosporangium transversale]|eukprot:XP_021875870.1 glutathione S-transferase [Lobosporangium transversale]
MTGPKLVLYNSVACPYAARAVIAAEETGAQLEIVPIDLNVPRPDWYLKEINPYGQVPALKVDDKHVILESLLVAEYLSDLHPGAGLFPTDPLQRAQTRYLIHHWGNRTHPAFHKAAFVLDREQAAKHREEFIVELEKFNRLLENVYRREEDGNGPFFLGDKFTFADLALGPFMSRFILLGAYDNGNKEVTLEDYPQFKRFFEWKDAVTKRPSVAKASYPREKLIEAYKKFLH